MAGSLFCAGEQAPARTFVLDCGVLWCEFGIVIPEQS